MEQMKSYKELMNRIQELIQKIEGANLSIDELFELERLTAKLHERSIILRYKAFENKLGLTKVEETVPEMSIQEEEVQEEEEEIEVIVEMEVEDDEVETEDDGEELEFSIFDSEEPEEETAPEPEIISEPIIDEIIEEEKNDVKTSEPEVKEEPKSDQEPKSFLDQFMAEDTSLSHQFSSSKLDTLIGAFGLNEKLRYINDLFDGSSELFSDAIKALDSRSSFDEASTLIEDYASKFEWDPSEETVAEFVVYIRRRYA